jgi:hypothetical protein
MTIAEGTAVPHRTTDAAASRPRAGSTAVPALRCLGGRAFAFSAVVAASAAVIGLPSTPRASSTATARRQAICAVLGQPWHGDQREPHASVQAR